jgi:trk system potassium uptake protein TrkA
MKVIICGAGQVGYNIARYLAHEENDVTVVDQSAELTRKISDTLDVKAFTGFASHPDVLARAGAEDTDMLIAVTQADEVNIVACQVAHSLFGITTKIARIRQQGYLEDKWANLYSRDHVPIDVIISPELEVANDIARRLRAPGAFDMISLADDKVKLTGVRCEDDCPVLNTPLRQLTQLFPDLNIIVVGIVRDNIPIIPTADDYMLPGDEVYLIVDSQHVVRTMAAFGHEEAEANRVVIFGGGNIGASLASQIETNYPSVNLKVIEDNKPRAELVARSLKRSVVLQGSVLDMEILEEANISATETIVAVTNDDETNIMASLLAKRMGGGRAITLINRETYMPLTPSLGIDVVVSPQNITVSSILQHVRRGRIHSAHTIGDGFGEIIEAEAIETTSLVGIPLKDTDLPDNVLVGAIVRADDVLVPRGDTIIQTNDRVILFAAADAVREVEKIFSVSLEYF